MVSLSFLATSSGITNAPCSGLGKIFMVKQRALHLLFSLIKYPTVIKRLGITDFNDAADHISTKKDIFFKVLATETILKNIFKTASNHKNMLVPGVD